MNRAAALGLVVWAALLLVSPWIPGTGLGTIERLFLFAPLVIVPLGFSLIAPVKSTKEDSFLRHAALLQPVAAVVLIACFLTDTQWLASALTVPWLVVCVLAAWHGLAQMWRQGIRFGTAVRMIALVYLLVGACWLTLSRAGAQPAGFQEPIVLLTAVHFHYSGFAAVLLSGRFAAQCANHPKLAVLAQALCAGTVLGMALIAVGFVASPTLKVVAIFFLATCLAGTALLTAWWTPEASLFATRFCLRVSSGAILAGMVLAALYGVGEFTGYLAIDMYEMASIHGTLNSLGFAFCGMLGWKLLGAKEEQ
jgi:hypothetical protein